MSSETDREYAGDGRPNTRMSRGFRRAVGILFLAFLVWLLLANHVILVTEEPAFVVLSKSTWTFDACVIVENRWLEFSLRHPFLSSRLASGDGLWILGDGR